MAENSEVKKDNSGMTEWKCQWRDPIRQPNEQPQVGDLLRLTCSGPQDQHLNENVFFIEKEESKHFLKVIRVQKSSPGELDLVVTSYRAGEHKDFQLPFSDGEVIAQTSPLNFTIQTVLPSDKQPEPYPYYGPFSAGYSIWLWVIIAALLLVLILPVAKYFRKRRQKRKLLEGTDLDMREQSLLHDMAKFYRQAKRDMGSDAEVSTQQCLDDIRKTLNEYLVIRYKVPAFDWSRSAIIADIKKHHKAVYSVIGVRLQKLLFELEQNKQIDISGCQQILESFRKFYEESERAVKAVKK